jgi:hypothetical protein
MVHINKGKTCTVPGCETPAICRGYCKMHYKRLLKHGDATVVKKGGNTPSATFRSCLVDGCDGNAHYTARGAHGYCRPHYRRWKTHGSPLEGYALWGAAQKFFDEIVIPCQSDECLTWPYGRRHGYASMNFDGTPRAVHRMACIAVHGEPPSSKHEAAHSCGNGRLGCVNPRHLRWATPSENQLDRALHGTSNRGERCGTAKLTRAQVREIRAQVGKRRVKDIAADYGVIPATVGDIRRRDTWFWLD